MNIALFGAGRIGAIHAANIVRHPDLRLTHVVDVTPQAARKLAGSAGARVSTTAEALADSQVDAVVIASSTDTHAELICAAAAAGKAILCEKPLDLDIERAERTLTTVRRAGVLLFLGFNRRYDPAFGRLRREIAAGTVGSVEVISIISRDPSPPPPEYIVRSGGLFRDMMIHDFDMARWLLGEEPATVFARGAALVDERIAAAGDIDTAVVVLETSTGKLCQITNSRRCAYGYDQRVEVFGSGGMVRADNVTATSVETAGAGGFAREPALPFFLERYAAAYRNELAHFWAAVQGREATVTTGEDGRRALLIANAAQQSLGSGAPVAVAV